ncbi:MAG: hypothetical protein CVU40_17365 [Chloroflexi bacterium HGW-Chloroflexi-2]|jgi:hypothetical protein|nr:MAG: hypothetical protein CVU40_17365 [Chloroflexi bacterium HGW-Chloroflexi-2]
MDNSGKINKTLEKWLSSRILYISIFFGILISWLTKNVYSDILFGSMKYHDKTLLTQFFYFVFFTILSSIFILLIQKISSKIPKNKSNISDKLDKIFGRSFLRDSLNNLIYALVLLIFGFSLIFFINNILIKINTTTWSYDFSSFIPIELPVGLDFRVGSYRPAQNLIMTNFKHIALDGTYFSIYPPLVSLINIPYLMFNENTAYFVHSILIFLSNIGCIAIVSIIAHSTIIKKIRIDKINNSFITITLFFILLFYTLSSYSFVFAIERGQTDVFALLFSLLSILFFIKKPDNIWLQVCFLSIAVHLKIYPAVLFLLLFVKHGRRLFFPAITINLIFLFILGPRMAFDFLQTLTSGSGIGAGIGNRWTWVGNHSAYSFADTLARESSNYSLNLYILWPIFTLIAIELWFAATYILFKNFSSQNAVLFFMVSISIMDLVPTISMDYRLVILSSAALLLIALIIKRIIENPSFFDYFQLGVVMLILLFIGRPYEMSDIDRYALSENASFFLNNKFLWSLSLEAIMVWNIFNNRKNSEIELKKTDL